MSLEMWEATARILHEYAKDPEVRVLVLTGAGGKAFVSGADISKFEDERSTKEASSATTRRSSTAMPPCIPSRSRPSP